MEILQIGTAQHSDRMTVFPLFPKTAPRHMYITLGEAMAGGKFKIREISEGGSVPELSVVNEGDVAVLLLDGEELHGAKQNRILNVSVLVGPGEEMVIPVSCTEQGRWRYKSKEFCDSGVIMARSIRQEKNLNVKRSLENSRHFQSDQGAVWEGVHELMEQAGIDSPTSAMKDVFESRQADLKAGRKKFPAEAGQTGMAVLINGKLAGAEWLSRSKAYAQIHEKLIDSYLLEVLLDTAKHERPASTIDPVIAFFSMLGIVSPQRYKSVGLGSDLRYEMPNVVGSALEVDNEIIHAAFFATNIKRKENLSGLAN